MVKNDLILHLCVWQKYANLDKTLNLEPLLPEFPQGDNKVSVIIKHAT